MASHTSSSRRCSHLYIIVLAVIVMMTVTARAQDSSHQKKDPYGLLFGTVWDAQGRPVYGVTVYIRPADKKKARWTLVSDHSGEFAQRVPAGDYVIWAEPKLKHQKRVQVVESKQHVELNQRIDFGLHLTE